MLIFRTLCGFAFQILPYTFFCIYPFADHFKISLKKALFLFFAVFALLAAGFTWIGVCTGNPFWEEYRLLFMNLFFYAALVLFFGLYLFLIRAHAFQKMFVFFTVMNYGFLVTMTVNFLLDIFPHTPDGYMYPFISLLYHFLIHVILFYPMLSLAKRVRQALKSPVEKKMWLLLSLVPGIFVLLVSIFGYLLVQTGFSFEYAHWTFLQVMLLFMLFIYNWIFRIMDQAKEKALQQSRLEAMIANYRKAAEDTAVIRRMHHEMRHHLGALSLYMKNHDYAGAQSYLDKLADFSANVPAAEYTPHPILNSMLAEYAQRARRAEILFTCSIAVPETIPMEDMDLCCLVTNLLDNALESCARTEASQRYIRLHIHLKGNFLFFSCQNSCDVSLLHYAGRELLTTKTEGTASHGLGISIMKSISSKYNGAFRTEASENRFTVSVNLCLADARSVQG